jgi:hypothetical protein
MSPPPSSPLPLSLLLLASSLEGHGIRRGDKKDSSHFKGDDPSQLCTSSLSLDVLAAALQSRTQS